MDIDNNNFKSEVLEYNGKVLLDFYATWCMPCKMMAPSIEKVTNELNVKLAKVDVDNNPELIKEYGIMSVPTLVLIENCKRINESIGLISDDELENFIKNS